MTKVVNVFLTDFPHKGNEMVVQNEDDTYTILINARLSDEGRLRAYEHAMKHINEEDFEKTDIQKIELEAHSLPVPPHTNPVEERTKSCRKRRRKSQKKQKEYDKMIEFLIQNGWTQDDFLARAEHYRLYGDFL